MTSLKAYEKEFLYTKQMKFQTVKKLGKIFLANSDYLKLETNIVM